MKCRCCASIGFVCLCLVQGVKAPPAAADCAPADKADVSNFSWRRLGESAARNKPDGRWRLKPHC
jgi:hypothetical protein